MNEFEQKLQRQPLREIPAGWRGEILAAARAAQETCHPSPVTHHSWLATLNQQLLTLFWPHPKAWAGLSAVWIFIFILNFSMRDPSPKIAERYAPPSPEVMVELKQQQRMYAELMGSREPLDANRQKMFLTKPRSQCMGILTV